MPETFVMFHNLTLSHNSMPSVTVFSMAAIMLIFASMCSLNLRIKCKIVVCCH